MTEPHYCRKSPTKAHHWIFPPQGSDNPFDAICKYCKKERTFAHHSMYFTTSDPSDSSWRAISIAKARGEKVT